MSTELAPIAPPIAPIKAALPTSPPLMPAINADVADPINAVPSVVAPVAPAPKIAPPNDVAIGASVPALKADAAIIPNVVQPPGTVVLTLLSKLAKLLLTQPTGPIPPCGPGSYVVGIPFSFCTTLPACGSYVNAGVSTLTI